MKLWRRKGGGQPMVALTIFGTFVFPEDIEVIWTANFNPTTWEVEAAGNAGFVDAVQIFTQPGSQRAGSGTFSSIDPPWIRIRPVWGTTVGDWTSIRTVEP